MAGFWVYGCDFLSCSIWCCLGCSHLALTVVLQLGGISIEEAKRHCSPTSPSYQTGKFHSLSKITPISQWPELGHMVTCSSSWEDRIVNDLWVLVSLPRHFKPWIKLKSFWSPRETWKAKRPCSGKRFFILRCGAIPLASSSSFGIDIACKANLHFLKTSRT